LLGSRGSEGGDSGGYSGGASAGYAQQSGSASRVPSGGEITEPIDDLPF
jgi:hypothetical protein